MFLSDERIGKASKEFEKTLKLFDFASTTDVDASPRTVCVFWIVAPNGIGRIPWNCSVERDQARRRTTNAGLYSLLMICFNEYRC